MVWIPLTDSNVGGASGASVVVVAGVVVVGASVVAVGDVVVSGLAALVLDTSAVVVVTSDP
jgi:hypothetical protein